MNLGQYAVGVGTTLVVLLCAAAVGVAGRRALVPRWSGAPAALAAVVVGYSFLVVEGELLGTFGLFSRWPIVIASVVIAAGVGFVGLRRGPVPATEATPADPVAPSGSPGWIASVTASACAALLLAQGLVAARATARTGNLFIDALEYHLTWAAHFATTHHTGSIFQIAPASPVSYYPLNSELLHGMGIALFHRDSLSLLLALADIAIALLAAWCVGSAFGMGPVALCAVSPVLALLGTFDASAINDWAAIWPLIAMFAFVVHFRNEGDEAPPGLPFLTGLAAGLALGAKVSLLAPAGALLIGFLVLVPSGRRLRATVHAVAGTALTAVYWYARDIVAVGSPLPSQHIPGLSKVPTTFDQYGFSVAHYLGTFSVIRHFFRPGLEFFFGKAWIALLLLAAIGVIVGVVLGPGTLRMAGIVAVVATIAYLVTPTGAYGPAGHPYLFGYNLRYALPAVVLGLLVLALSKTARQWPGPTALVFLACLVVTLVGPRMWAMGHGTTIAAVVLAFVVVAVVRLPVLRHHAPAAVAVVVAVAVVAGYPLNHRYLRDRYHTTASAKEALYASLQSQTGKRIGVVGSPVLYPFLGPTYANTVTYIAKPGPHHAFLDYTACGEWRAAVAAGNYAYVVVELSSGNPPPPALQWTRTDPAATEVVANAAGSVFIIRPGFGTATCPAT
ncbi:MAG TPA: hypothetical protein VG650_10355 [Mycobacteriales bacterium]|nr:hypothetical protein [Mycobacteriales bacterium]